MDHSRIIFIHIAKTAGRSVNDVLRQAYGANAVCDCGPSDLPDLGAAPQHRVYSGHFSLPAARRAFGPGFHFTFLRDPIERLVSHYYHFKNFSDVMIADNPGAFWFIPDIKRMTLHQFLVSEMDPLPFHVDNHLTRYFLGPEFFDGMAPVSIRGLPYARRMAVARHALEAMYSLDYLGFTGSIERSIEELLALLGLGGVPIEVPRLNTGSYQRFLDRHPLDEDVLMELLRNTEIDRLLYARALELRNHGRAQAPAERRLWKASKAQPAFTPRDLNPQDSSHTAPAMTPAWAAKSDMKPSPRRVPQRMNAGECDVVWLASCPRSGNTWLRAMLIALRDGPATDLHTMQSLVPDLSGPPQSAELRADLACAADHSPVLVKTHYLFDDACARLATNGLEPRSHRILLLVRDPVDMVVSQFDFMMLTSMDQIPKRESAAWRDLRNRFVTEFVETGGRVPYRTSIMVDVLAFVESWRAAIEAHGGLVVRYEELCADPVGRLGHIATYAGLPSDPARIEAAVDACRFDVLRALEERSIIEGVDRNSEFFRPWALPGYMAGLRFFNEARAGRGRALLSKRQVGAVVERFRPMHDGFGYDSDGCSDAGPDD